MRVLQIAPPWFTVPPERYGGTELVVAGLVDRLVATGHDTTLVASGGSSTRGRVRTIYRTPPSAELGDAVVELPHVLAGYRLRHGFDIVHDHTVTGIGVGALLDGPPLVHTVHGAWVPALARLYAAVADRVNLVAISQDHAARAPADVALSGVVHNGIEVERYPLGTGTGGYLAWLGRAGADKGADIAVEIAGRLRLPLRMAMKVSEAAEHRWWQEILLPMLPGTDTVVVHNATHGQKVALLAGARALLFPIRWDEPFGLAMIEANACGTPVVAFARGAAPELVDDGHSGFLVAPDDLDAMAAAASEVPRLDRHACRTNVERRFTAARMTAGYLRLFERLIPTRTIRLPEVGRSPPGQAP